MSKPIYIFSISRNYTRCEVWHGSRSFKNRIGTSTLTPDKALSRHERYLEIAKWLRARFELLPPSYQTSEQRRLQRSAIQAATATDRSRP